MKRLFLIVSLVAALGITPLFGIPQASSVSGSDFQAGRLIDDAVFFSINTISPSEIQAFLNSKVPVCDTWHPSSNPDYQPPFTCLKEYTQSTPDKPAEAGLCNYYSGNGGVAKPAAQIIYDVGQACGVNPKALIVLLEKEQSLVTDTWPWSIQYRSATGYGCPDTAPCDAEYYGFFNQVYNAARQFRRYQRDETLFRYRANRDNYIQYHPNTACGGTNVFIQNQATAGLYNYTPYQPNATALSNIYGGQSDGCSSYGNRNFWRIFNDWFGSVNGGPYEWQLVSQEAYSDAAMTRSYTSVITTEPNEKIYFRIKARNTGYLPWDSSFMRIGTSAPRDRASTFQDTTWLNHSRPAQLTEASVAPSQIGTFDFVMKAPPTTGSYYEYFTPVADGQTWLRNIGMFYPINVVSPVPPTNTTKFSLNAGEELQTNEHILSPDTQSALVVQGDGKAVLYSNFSNAVWSTGTQSAGASKMVMQEDGNLVLYAQNGTVLWNAGTNGNPGARLVLQTDGNMVIYNQSNVAVWSAAVGHSPDHLKYVNTTLRTGVVFPGQSLETADRKYRLIFQTDGNLVIYSPNRATWSSGTFGRQATRLVMQADGHLVIYNSVGQAIWYTNTLGHGHSSLVMQQDGNLVLYKGTGQVTWTTHTAGQN